MHKINLIYIVLVGLLLAGCSTKASIQKTIISPEESVRRAMLIEQLPENADIGRIEEQIIWIEKGIYITKENKYQLLPHTISYQKLNLSERPNISTEKVVKPKLTPVLLSLPK